MESRQPVRPRLFKADKISELNTLGEYGKPEKPDGWVRMAIAGHTIYLASENFAEKLASHYNIPARNIVSLICPAPNSKHGIPEELLPGDFGLELFNDRLSKVDRIKSPIIIHCKYGLNRTPVAAVLYLIRKNISPARAAELVTAAYREQREEKFVLNKRGHYSLVLEEVGIVLEQRLRSRTAP